MSDRETLDVSGQQRSGSPQPTSNGSTKASLFQPLSQKNQKPYIPTYNASSSSSSSERTRLIVPTAIWILVVVASLCFLSLLSSLNRSISRLDSMIELEQDQAALLRSYEMINGKQREISELSTSPSPVKQQNRWSSKHHSNKEKKKTHSEDNSYQNWINLPPWVSLEPISHHHEKSSSIGSPLSMIDQLFGQIPFGPDSPLASGDGETSIIISASGSGSGSDLDPNNMFQFMTDKLFGPTGQSVTTKESPKSVNEEKAGPITANIHKLTVNIGDFPGQPEKKGNQKKPQQMDGSQLFDEVLQQIMTPPIRPHPQPPSSLIFDSEKMMNPFSQRRPAKHNHHHHNHEQPKPTTDEQVFIIPLDGPNSLNPMDLFGKHEKAHKSPYELNQAPVLSQSDIDLVSLVDNLTNELISSSTRRPKGDEILPIIISDSNNGLNKDNKKHHNQGQRRKHQQTNNQQNNEAADLFQLFFGPPPKSDLVVMSSGDSKVGTKSPGTFSEPKIEFFTDPLMGVSGYSKPKVQPIKSSIDAGSPTKRPSIQDESKMIGDMIDQMMAPLMTLGQFSGQPTPQQIVTNNDNQRQQQGNQVNNNTITTRSPSFDQPQTKQTTISTLITV